MTVNHIVRSYSTYMKWCFNVRQLVHKNNVYSYFMKGHIRMFVSPSLLGIYDFQKVCSKIRRNMDIAPSTFIDMVQESIKSEEEVVHSNDVKKMVAVCECDPTYLTMTMDLVKKYCDDCKILDNKQDMLRVGPILARLLYVLRKPDIAFKIMQSSDQEIFSEYKSYLIVLDLLYEQRMYVDVIELMAKILKHKLLQYPKDCLTIACAAAYKTNTEESLKISSDWLVALVKDNLFPGVRSIIFVSALALHQKQVHLAKQFLSKLRKADTLLITNSFTLCSCHLGEFDDILEGWRVCLQMNKFQKPQPIVSRDVVNEMEVMISATENKSLIEEFHKLQNLLEKCQLVSSLGYEQLLFEPITDAIKVSGSRLSRRELEDLLADVEDERH